MELGRRRGDCRFADGSREKVLGWLLSRWWFARVSGSPLMRWGLSLLGAQGGEGTWLGSRE